MKHICDCCQRDCLVVVRVVSLDVSTNVPFERLCSSCAKLVRSERSYMLVVNPFAIERLRDELQEQLSAA